MASGTITERTSYTYTHDARFGNFKQGIEIREHLEKHHGLTVS
jgi:hypothetical protein